MLSLAIFLCFIVTLSISINNGLNTSQHLEAFIGVLETEGCCALLRQ